MKIVKKKKIKNGLEEKRDPREPTIVAIAEPILAIVTSIKLIIATLLLFFFVVRTRL